MTMALWDVISEAAAAGVAAAGESDGGAAPALARHMSMTGG